MSLNLKAYLIESLDVMSWLAILNCKRCILLVIIAIYFLVSFLLFLQVHLESLLLILTLLNVLIKCILTILLLQVAEVVFLNIILLNLLQALVRDSSQSIITCLSLFDVLLCYSCLLRVASVHFRE